MKANEKLMGYHQEVYDKWNAGEGDDHLCTHNALFTQDVAVKFAEWCDNTDNTEGFELSNYTDLFTHFITNHYKPNN